MAKQLSEYDGKPLPVNWDYRHPSQKGLVIRLLNGSHEGPMPQWWIHMSIEDRNRVIKHLDCRRLTTYDRSRSFAEVETMTNDHSKFQQRLQALSDGEARVISEAFRSQHKDITRFWFDESSKLPYVRPNGGLRMLPSLYGRLRKFWVRSSKQPKAIADMNNGHLANSISLLKESHGNVSAKAQELLGKVRYHYQNQPKICEGLDKLLELMWKVEVEDMYPIFTALSTELHSRQQMVVDVDPLKDNLSDWMDSK